MKYMIVSDYRQEVFEKLVQSMLDQGWKLQGGVSITVNVKSGEIYTAQALVKEEK